MEAEYPDAILYFVDPSRVFGGQNSHSAIVLHGTGGPNPDQTAQELGDYFRTNSAMVSVHFGIDRTGVVCQYVSLEDGAAGNCCLEAGHDPFWDQFGNDNLNVHTISVEHENDISNSLPLTPPQAAASFKLVAWLCQQYGLGPDQIKTHASIAPSNRARCPGGAFPVAELVSFIGGTAVTPPNPHIVKAAQDTWNRTAFLFGGTPLPYNTGIAQSWQNIYINQQTNMPPPTTREFRSVDWSGSPITVQFFGSVRCEWDANAQAHWFNT